MKSFKLNNKNQDIKIYKLMLKEISSINLRRSSKFNILAIYGALKCMEDVNFSNNLGIYIATKYGPVQSVKKVLNDISEGLAVKPFDFLNINSNNVSFYVAQALNASGKNMVITSSESSFEKAVELANFDMSIGEVDDALIGLVDESIDGINNQSSEDMSHWIYVTKESLKV